MKKIYLFATMIAATAFGLTSCSDSNGGDSPSGADGEGEAYVAIRLNNVGTVPGMGSKPFLRASTVPGYENGTPDEGNITKARFYFFNSDGSAFNLAGSNVNYTDQDMTMANPNPITQGEDENITEGDQTTVERKTEAVLVINGASSGLPARIAVVANNDQLAETVLGSTSLSETQLAALTRTTQKYAGAEDKNFVMSNSVYLNESNAALLSTPIDASSFRSTAKDATDNPVSIYVERIAARVDVTAPTVAEADAASGWVKANTLDNTFADDVYAYKLNMNDDNNKLDFVTININNETGAVTRGENQTVDQLYVVVKGWGLADENNNGAVEKTLASSYDGLASTEVLANNPLSVAAYHRSFWETSSAYTPARYSFNNYISATTADGYVAPTSGTAFGKQLGGKAYTFPNTAATATYTWDQTNRRTAVGNISTQAPTKVVVAAQLMHVVSDKLEPAEICTYRNNHYTSENFLKIAIANDVKNSSANAIYKQVSDNKYETIGTGDFTFEVGTPGSTASYKLKPTLNAGTYYKYNASTKSYDVIEQTAAQEALENVAGKDITIYKSGDTYYYTTLQHIWFPTDFAAANSSTTPTNVGAWGVVRNHLYRVALNTFTGWGTPVYDPNEAIVPITPSDQNVYLGAEINVLQWRVVNQTANMDGSVVTTE